MKLSESSARALEQISQLPGDNWDLVEGLVLGVEQQLAEAREALLMAENRRQGCDCSYTDEEWYSTMMPALRDAARTEGEG